jgi:hypothetical protein
MATKIQRMYQCFKFRKQVNRYMLMLKNLKYKLHFRLAAYRMKKYAKQIVRVQRFLRGKLQLKKRIRLLQVQLLKHSVDSETRTIVRQKIAGCASSQPIEDIGY